MPIQKIAGRPDLRPLFAGVTPEENEALLDRLESIESELKGLADAASTHVGVPYAPTGLDLSLRPDGGALGIDGGAAGAAGDIWFDVSPRDGVVGPPWTVESRVVVFCSDSPEPRGEGNTHDLVRLEGSAGTPSRVLDVLESQMRSILAEILRRSRQAFTETPHSKLP